MKKIKFSIITCVILIVSSFIVHEWIGFNFFFFFIKYPFSHETTIMDNSVRLNIDVESLRQIDNEYGDWLVHPCVRYIPEGFQGHKWWMVVTPYPKYNNYYENPILYYGDENSNYPPNKWHFVAVVQKSHKTGYNADGNLYFDGNKLWIFWKEKDTPNSVNSPTGNCVMGVSYDGNSFSNPKMFLDNNDSIDTRITAPCVMVINDTIKCLTTAITDIENRTSIRNHGNTQIAVWALSGSDLCNEVFKFQYDVKPVYPADFDFWHADYFKYKGLYYCVVSNQAANKILLGKSINGIDYSFYEKPLLSTDGNLYTYMYKPSAVVVNEEFYLFYPRKLLKTNHVGIYMSHMKFEDVLQTVE